MRIAPAKITRIYADGDGESRFEDVQVSCSEAGFGFISDALDVDALYLRETPGAVRQDWHVAPRRQYVVLLSGSVEIEVSDGEVRRFAAGDVLLAEDTTGKGHRTTALTAAPRRSLFLTLPEGA